MKYNIDKKHYLRRIATPLKELRLLGFKWSEINEIIKQAKEEVW